MGGGGNGNGEAETNGDNEDGNSDEGERDGDGELNYQYVTLLTDQDDGTECCNGDRDANTVGNGDCEHVANENGTSRREMPHMDPNQACALVERMLAREEAAYRACLAMDGRLGNRDSIEYSEPEERANENVVNFNGTVGDNENVASSPTSDLPQDTRDSTAVIDEQTGMGNRSEEMTDEDIDFIRTAMQQVHFSYVPHWARNQTEDEWMDKLRKR